MPYLFEVVTICISLLISLICIPLVIKLCHTYKILDLPGQHKRHKQPVPLLGGVALFVVVWLTVLATTVIFGNLFDVSLLTVLFIFFGALIILLVGLSDDLKPLSAWVKLLAQIAAGLLLYFGDVSVEFLTTPFGSIDIGSFSIIITILWVVMLTNAINLIDGLDGLATGVSLIAAITMLIIGQLYQTGGILVFILTMIGFFTVFLYYNKYPARIFLGDSGSMQIGEYSAVFSLLFPVKSYTVTALYLPLLGSRGSFAGSCFFIYAAAYERKKCHESRPQTPFPLSCFVWTQPPSGGYRFLPAGSDLRPVCCRYVLLEQSLTLHYFSLFYGCYFQYFLYLYNQIKLEEIYSRAKMKEKSIWQE